MYDELLENDPKIKKMLAESEARGTTKGEARGEVKGLREAIVSLVEMRFPSLQPLAQKRVAQIKKPDALRSLFKSIYAAPDEATIRILLRTTVA